jgi:hypothetical protein
LITCLITFFLSVIIVLWDNTQQYYVTSFLM